MTNQIDQSEINNILWAACDTFRGTVDPSQYKDYILVMLFVITGNIRVTPSN